MIVTPVRTHKITDKDKDIRKILDKYIKDLGENSVVAVTSKIVAITEGRFVEIEGSDKDNLIKQESQYYLPREENPYNVTLTISHDSLIAGAGIDESNADGNYILWPKDPQESANKIREYLAEKFKIKNVGVVITDSKTTPMRWGVTAVSIASSGFDPLKDYIGTKDLFGRKFEFEKLNFADSLAAASGAVMGEGSEQTPLAIITDIPFITFTGRDPTREEVSKLKISLEEDLYSPLLKSVEWKKGRRFS